MSRRELVGLILGIALFVLFLILPPIGQITPLGMRTLGVFALTLVWWITEPVPMGATSFLALAVALAMSCSYAFAFPSGSPATAIVYATGYISIKEMLKNGLITALICILTSSLLTYIVASWLIPYP